MHRTNISQAGTPLREFLWSEDMADACVYIMENVEFKDVSNPLDEACLSAQTDRGDPRGLDQKIATATPRNEIRNTHINIGSGEENSISDLAKKIKSIVKLHLY